MKEKTITDLRDRLFEMIDAVKNGTVDIEKAKVVNELGKTIIHSAKVEVDFLRVSDRDSSYFIQPPILSSEQKAQSGITGIVQHRIGK
jgi:hypothetical protein